MTNNCISIKIVSVSVKYLYFRQLSQNFCQISVLLLTLSVFLSNICKSVKFVSIYCLCQISVFPSTLTAFLLNICISINFVGISVKYLYLCQPRQHFCKIFVFLSTCQYLCQISVFPSTSSVFLSNICISLPSLECRRIGRAAVLRLQMSSSCRSGLNTNHHIKKGFF